MRLSCVAAVCVLLAACASTSTSNPPQTQPSAPAAATTPAPTNAPPPPAASPASTAAPAGGGVYTQAQAQRGRTIFEGACTSCHAASDFSGDAFRSRWGGSTADEIYNLVRTSMPQDSPGSLEPQQYADVIAFFFNASGMPAGPTELKGDEDVMREITIVR